MFYNLEPWGGDRSDLGTGILASLMANLWGKKRTKPEDFIPDYDGSRSEKQSNEEMRSRFREWASKHNASLRR